MDYHNVFNEESELYAKVRPLYPKALFKYLTGLCNEHTAAWDGACGNGQAAVGLASYLDDVQATDVSEGQIANAIENPKITYSVQPSEATNFQKNQFDLVCIAQALHWFDYDLFWPEVKRVLKPAGIFAAWGYSWFSVEDGIDECISEKFLKFLEPYWSARNILLWDSYRKVPFPFPRIDAPKIEMVMEWNLSQVFAYLRSWSATQRCLEDIGKQFLLNAYEAVLKEWGDPTKREKVKMDFCLLVGRNEI
jgi:SAM-dependent methyltransferase